MRKKVIAGNWKMHNLVSESLELVKALKPLVADVEDVEIVVCPVYTSLYAVGSEIKGSNIKLGAQDCFWEEKGAFTGEVSPWMLRDVGAEFVIIGHSERRQYFCETDEWVNKKVKSAIKAGLTPIVCVGEKLEEREANRTFEVVRSQLDNGLGDLSPEEAGRIIIAYEPVWAIGTGKTATPEQAQEVHAFIRGWFRERFGDSLADALRIQYGGSVKPTNARDLLSQEDIDGALVGGASLKADTFAEIVKSAL